LPTRRILLADDEATTVVPIARYFRNLRSAVDLALQPEQAIALIRRRDYDLVVLKLWPRRLGSADGLEVLRDLRDRGLSTCVIALSAGNSQGMEEEAVRLGANAVLRKPLALLDIAQTVFDLMREEP
jgi:two-component system OmpR family response regulator